MAPHLLQVAGPSFVSGIDGFAQRTLIMRYLGGLTGSGVLHCNGEPIARASYDFDGFFTKPAGVTGCGEIQLSAAALKSVFGRRDVRLLTDDGRHLNLKFSEKTLLSAREIAHVDVTGELPTASRGWRH